MNQTTGEQKWTKEEWGAWKFVSEMLDNPDKDGLYPTSKCYEQIYDFVVEQKKQSLKQLIDGLVESLDGKREKDLSDKDIEDRLRVFTLTPSSEESIKEFVKVIGGISAKMGKNKAINDQISYLEKIRKQLE